MSAYRSILVGVGEKRREVRGRLAPDAVAERAGVRVAVDGDDAVAAVRRERVPDEQARRRLADAALAGDEGDLAAAGDGRLDPARRALAGAVRPGSVPSRPVRGKARTPRAATRPTGRRGSGLIMRSVVNSLAVRSTCPATVLIECGRGPVSVGRRCDGGAEGRQRDDLVLGWPESVRVAVFDGS